MPLVKNIIAIGLVFLSLVGIAQLDKEHYIPPMYASDHSWTTPGDQVVYISTPSVSPVNYLISDGAGNILQSGTVSNASPVSYSMNGFGTPFIVDDTELHQVLTSRGIQVAAAEEVYCNLRARSSNGSQAASLTCKGLSGLGKTFRIGHFPSPQTNNTNKTSTFGIYATQNGTNVTIDLTASGVVLHGAGAPSTGSVINVTLNRGETYVVAMENPDHANNAGKGMNGALVTADKPIAINTGSWGGNLEVSDNVDVGIDQIVPIEKVGTEYAIVRGASNSNTHEQVMVVAHENNTEVYINGGGVPVTTLAAGDNYLIDGSNYVSDAMYVVTSKPAYLYQFVLGSNGVNTQGMNFLPPISCRTPNIVNNIPEIEKIGATTYGGGISIVTTTGATVLVNGAVPGTAPVAVPGSIYEMYKISGLTGNVSISSSTIALVGFVGQSGAAGYGGYFSGFEDLTVDKDFNCLPGYIYETTGRFSSYQWYKDGVLLGGETNDSLFVSGSGSYTLEYTLGACKDTSNLYLAVDTPSFTFSGDTTFCVGDSAILNITGPSIDSISWSTGHTTSQAIVKNGGNINARIYADVAAGCYVDTTIVVQEKLPPTINLTIPNDTICIGETATITAVHTGDTIWWNTGDNTNSINITAKGKYYADVRTGKACFASDTIEIKDAAFPSLILSAQVDTICTGDSVFVTATTAADSSGWSTGETNSGIWIKSAGDYVFTASNNPNCRVKDTVKIAEYVVPTLSVSMSDDSVCAGDSITITLTTNADSVLWSNNDTSKVLVVKTTSNLIATVTNGNFCKADTTVSPVVRNFPIISLSKETDTICSGDSSFIAVSGTYDVLTWSDAGVGNNRYAKVAGDLIATATNSPGCATKDTFKLAVINTPSFALSETKDSICTGDSAVLTLLTNADSVLWNTGSTSKIVSAKVNGWYVATVSNGGKCEVKDSIFIYEGSFPTITIASKLDSICTADSILKTITTSGSKILWDNGDTTSQSYLKGTQDHIVTVTNTPGCSTKDTVRTVEVVKPTLSLSTNEDTICSGDSTVLKLTTNAAVYAWSNGSTEDSITVKIPAKYSVSAYILSSCIVKDSITVTEIDVPSFYLPSDTLGCKEEQMILAVNSMDSIVWQSTISAPSYAPLEAGTYSVEVFNKCGSAEKFVQVEFEDCTEGIVMPNVITPNNDGINDFFAPIKWKEVSSAEITIYNRWGLKVFYSNQESFTWDGTVEGIEVVEGTYFWTVEYINTSGTKKSQNGFVYLKR